MRVASVAHISSRRMLVKGSLTILTSTLVPGINYFVDTTHLLDDEQSL